VQTFLPYADFARSAASLDSRRLGKQRVEALQVVRAVTVPGYGWRHHPVAAMWRGHEEALAAYGVAVCAEWVRRGHADTCERKILDDVRAAGVEHVRTQAELAAAAALPPWLGDEALHRSHRVALRRKDPDFYGPMFADEDVGDLEAGSDGYVWPVRPGAG